MPENICKDNKKVDINQTFRVFFSKKWDFSLNLVYFLPKSAGISPHLSVCHLIIGFLYVLFLNHDSALSIIW